jgi:hypothetical protein
MLLDIINNIDSDIISSDDDSIVGIQNERLVNDQDGVECTPDHVSASNYPNFNYTTYKRDDDDTYWNESLNNLSIDSTSPLYKNSCVTVKAASVGIMSVAIECNFPKSVVEQILKVVKSFLPVPNLLPTTYASVMKAIGTKSLSSSRYYCNSCNQLCTMRAQRKFCENNKCGFNNQSLRNHDISEIVSLDIKEQLKSILGRNMSLFDNPELFPPSDIKSSRSYKESTQLIDELSK